MSRDARDALTAARNSGNAEAIEARNTVLFEKFLRFQHLLTTGLSTHSVEAFRRHPPRPGARLLDIGCGFGDTTLELARLVGKRGEVVGVDAAKRFVEHARRDAEAAGCSNVRFVTDDAEGGDLGGPYDAAYSRFGTMFFASPVAALRNVRRSLASEGELVIIVWRRREDNAWLHSAELRVREIIPENAETNAPTCGPGPFSMSGPDMVSDQLKAAGYSQIGFDRFDSDICIGKDLDEAIEFAMALGPAGEILRLAGAEGERRKPEVVRALRETLSEYARAEGVYAPSSTWIVTACAE